MSSSLMPQNVNTTHPPLFTINRIYLTSTSISFYYSQSTHTHTRAFSLTGSVWFNINWFIFEWAFLRSRERENKFLISRRCEINFFYLQLVASFMTRKLWKIAKRIKHNFFTMQHCIHLLWLWLYVGST